MTSNFTLFERLWERHKNPLSWYIRPFLGALVLYASWQHQIYLIVLGLIGLATSWFWFPPPKKPKPKFEKFIDIEREYLTPPYTLPKIISIITALTFIPLIIYFFWTGEYKFGLAIFGIGSLIKSVWSLVVARQSGVPAAIIGIITFIICMILIHTT